MRKKRYQKIKYRERKREKEGKEIKKEDNEM